MSDRPKVPGDSPAETPRPPDAADLESRRGRLAPQHPSSPRYHDAPAARRQGLGADRPGATEWHDAIAGPKSKWDSHGLAGHPDRPSPEKIRLTPDRREHILSGDEFGGGHRSGTGIADKTEFPKDWGDGDIAEAVLSVARSPDTAPELQSNGRWYVRGTREGVETNVIIESDGRIWTAWPSEDSPGVVRNKPEE